MVYDVDRYSSEFNLCKEKITSLTDEITNLSMNNTTYDVTILQGKDRLNKLENNLTDIRNKILEKSIELGEIAETKDGIIQSKIPDVLFLKSPIDEF